ncbi:MAG: N-acetylmuramoyl-L-alanine amidase, partial [Myxococcales bacterium]|nr:N-acetylmuramoyl-L-alanine amidase [Myxococcales bacterium]
GGSNKGAVGYHAGREKQLTLEISRVLKRYIESRSNVRVTLTRHADVDLALRHRPRLANKIGGDALISVHCNASVKSTVRGMEVWFLTADSSMRVIHDIVRREEGVPDTGPEVARQWTAQGVVETLRHAQAHRASQAFAIALRHGLMRARPKTRFRGIKQDAFGVLKEARMPAVVLEVGYITHPEESLELLKPKTQQAIARGVLIGLLRLDQDRERLRRSPSKGTNGRPQARKPTKR